MTKKNRPAPAPPKSSAVLARSGARQIALAIFGVLVIFLASGCKEDTIGHYQVSKDERAAQRLLGAIIPHGERTWFFKLLGPKAAVGEHEKEFGQFIQSVRFTDKDVRPVTWTVPEGWVEKPGSGLRHAAFSLGTKEAPLELTVIPLGEDARSLLDNVNRWRGQIGLPKVTENELGGLIREIKVDGKTVTLVDLKTEDAAPAGDRGEKP